MKVSYDGSEAVHKDVYRNLMYTGNSKYAFTGENGFDDAVGACTQVSNFTPSNTPIEYNVTQVELLEVSGTIEGTTLTASTDDFTQGSIFASNDKWYKIDSEATASDDKFTYTIEEIIATEVEISDNKFSSTEEFNSGDYVTDGTDLYQVSE